VRWPQTLRGQTAVIFSAGVIVAVLVSAGMIGVALWYHEAEAFDRLTAQGHRLPMAERHDALMFVRTSRVLAVGVVLLGAAALGFGSWAAGRALRPLKEAARRARDARAARGPLELPVRGTADEWDDLAGLLNEMLREQRKWTERSRGFGAAVAHELRTPLTVLLGEVQIVLARTGRSEAAYREALSAVEAEAQRMVRVIDAVFTMVRSDAGELATTGSEFDLAAVARRAAERAAVAVEAAGKRVAVATTPVEAHGDPELTARILDNLLENAVRHGGRQLEVVVSSDRGRPVVAVSDDGEGLPPAVLERLFERYNRGGASRSGMGLGLFIAHALADAQRATLRLDRPGGRTRFSLTLVAPAAAADQAQGR
jgi:two-component system heavy metal sensor histidine kinase CusS